MVGRIEMSASAWFALDWLGRGRRSMDGQFVLSVLGSGEVA